VSEYFPATVDVHDRDPQWDYEEQTDSRWRILVSDAIMFEGMILTRVHGWWDCQGMDYDPPKSRVCVIHRPTPHHMRLWPLTWRDDRGIFERQCTHGVGHPDPDQFPYWEECDRMYEAVHGCDGCCRPPRYKLTGELF
jgi:hypothetical protein